ncbi:MAG: hypothetical protein HOW73_46700 [Polyangiaceae bacterium]|nr:hypothetical protein [Polyangiaceae bacterium]
MRTWSLAIIGLGTLVGCVQAAPESESESEEVGEEAVASSEEAIVDASVKLKQKNHAVFWDGTVSASDTPHANAPPECSGIPCDHVRLKIELPNGTFQNPNKPGGVQVALRWFGNPGPHELPPDVPGCCGEFDTLHLWVYKDGDLVAASPGIIAVSQSAFIPSPENGWYDVWIAWDPSYNVAPFVDYEALADVEFSPKTTPVRRLLPDLEFRGTERITFDTPSFPIFEPDPPPGSSCFQSEMDEDGAQNCLRFDQIIANVGAAPVEIGWSSPTGTVPDDDDTFPVTQTVYYSNGSTQSQEAGEVEFHGVHGHYHYSSFANAALWQSNANGARIGNAPLRGAQKVSFCMADIRIDAWGEKGDGPRKYYAPDCLFPASSDGVTDEYRQGISNGWADVYDWYIPDQYIEVTGIPGGHYLLEFCADPFNEIEEDEEDNNCIANHIFLSNMGTPSQHVQVLGIVDDDDDGGCHHHNH